MKYNVDYFIAKFQAIPEHAFCTQELETASGKHCVLGFCGVTVCNALKYSGVDAYDFTEEALALIEILKPLSEKTKEKYVANAINDGAYIGYNQDTPKQRILAALYDIKKIQKPEAREDITKLLAVESVSETLDVTPVLVPNPHP